MLSKDQRCNHSAFQRKGPDFEFLATEPGLLPSPIQMNEDIIRSPNHNLGY